MAAANSTSVATAIIPSCSLKDKPLTELTFSMSDFILAEPYRHNEPKKSEIKGVCSFFNQKSACCSKEGASIIDDYVNSVSVDGDTALKFSNAKVHFTERLDILAKGGWLSPSAHQIALEATKHMGTAFDSTVNFGKTCTQSVVQYYGATLCELACDPEANKYMYEEFAQTGEVIDKEQNLGFTMSSRHPAFVVDETVHYYLRAQCLDVVGELDVAEKEFSKAGKVFQQALDLLVSAAEKDSANAQVPVQEFTDIVNMMERNAFEAGSIRKMVKKDKFFRERMYNAGMGYKHSVRSFFFPFLYPITAVSEEADFDAQQRFRSYAFEGAKEELLDSKVEQHRQQTAAANQAALDSRLAVVSIKDEITEDPSLAAAVDESLKEVTAKQDVVLLQTKTKKMALIDRHDSSLSSSFLEVDGASESAAPVDPEEAMFGTFAVTDGEDKAGEEQAAANKAITEETKATIQGFNAKKGVTTAQRIENRAKIDAELETPAKQQQTEAAATLATEDELFAQKQAARIETTQQILEEVNRPDAFIKDSSSASVVAGTVQDSGKSVHKSAPSKSTRMDGAVTNTKRSSSGQEVSLSMFAPSTSSYVRMADTASQNNILTAAAKATNRTIEAFPAHHFITFPNAEGLDARAAALKAEELSKKTSGFSALRAMAQKSSIYGFILAGVFGSIGVVGLLMDWLNLAQAGFATASGFTAGAYGCLGISEDVTALVLFICAIITLVGFGALEIRRVMREAKQRQRDAEEFVLGGLEDEDGDIAQDEVEDAADEGAERKPLNDQKYMA